MIEPTVTYDPDDPTRPARTQAWAPFPTAIGNYRVLDQLGRGGYGVVFLARDERLQREVAIKLLPFELERDPEERDRFLLEARTLAALNHPNIAIIYSLEEHEGRHFVTMERIEGHSLWHRLREGPLALDEALAIVRQVAWALEAAHAKGVVHRDLKPSNVMLREDGTAKVLDFGLALRLGPTQDRAASGGEIAGTPGYMSPEQARGEPVDARSDMWALGALLYECLAGRRLVTGATAREKIAATLELDVAAALAAPRPEPLPQRVSRLLARCLAARPAERFASVREARLLLEEEIAERALPAGADLPIAPAGQTPGNLPRRLTRFVGRQREVETATRLLFEHRLLTITGAGGCGKSRLSLVLAAQLGAAAPDGAWLVELAPLTDPARLAATVDAALGVHHPSGDALDALLAFIRDKRLLLILDNCEHLLDACAELATRVLAACPNARILATSREALRVEGEATFVLPPLGLPAGRATAGGSQPPPTPTPSGSSASRAAAVDESDAVRLFVDRARAVLPGFVLDESNRATVAEICRRLDGIPLAIELAAARMKALSEEKILDLLGDRFRLLTRGTRAGVAHQQTLRALIDWSYDRLEPGEQAVLRRLAVFRGAWTLEGAESVAAGGDVASWEVLDLFMRLVEKSLVMRLTEAQAGMGRYSLLETIREYAYEKLLERPDEAAEAARRHREYIVALAIEGFAGLKGPSQAQWTVRLDDVVNDVRAVGAALASDPRGAEAELRLASMYGLHWMKRGMWTEGREALERALARPDADRASLPYAQALLSLGNLDYRMAEFARAREHYTAALEGFRVSGGDEHLANVTMNLGNVDWSQGDMDRAQHWYETSLEHYRRAGSAVGAAGCLSNLGAIAISREDFDTVEVVQAEAIAIFESIGVTDNICLSLFGLGITAIARGDFDLAEARLGRALALARASDNRWNILAALDNLAGLANHRGRSDAAREPLLECLARLRDMRDPIIGLSVVENSAHVVRASSPADAATLFAAAAALRVKHQLPGLSYEKRLLGRQAAELRARLGEAAFDQLSTEGAALSLVDALARAEALLGVGRS